MSRRRGYRSKVKVKVDTRDLRRLRSQAKQVLRELDVPLHAAVRRVLDQASFLVPRGGAPDDPLNLADTGFIDGPEYNFTARLSTTWVAGYAHPHAGAIHQGFHWGLEFPPPLFLRRAVARGVRAPLRKAVGRVLMSALARYFPRQ